MVLDTMDGQSWLRKQVGAGQYPPAPTTLPPSRGDVTETESSLRNALAAAKPFCAD